MYYTIETLTVEGDLVGLELFRRTKGANGFEWQEILLINKLAIKHEHRDIVEWIKRKGINMSGIAYSYIDEVRKLWAIEYDLPEFLLWFSKQ